MEKHFTKPFEWIISNRFRWLFHLLFWLVIYIDEFLSLFGITPSIDFTWLTVLEITADVALVYFNLYVLIPYFLLKNKVFSYIILTLITLFLNAVFMAYLYFDIGIDSPDFLPSIISVLLTTGSILGTAVGVKIFKYFIRNRQTVQELRHANLKTELTFLKDQINPHFLFNALNNIYVQSRKRPKEVPESILLLSDLLRYQLYDCSNEKVPLKNEIEYLKNYLELDKMRKTGTDVQFEITGEPNGTMVAPFIFLPFVENAVKYSATPEEKSFIKINFDIRPDKIQFNISNSYDNYENLHRGGIGQANVNRRLELLYPNRYELNISDKNRIYSIDLNLKIQPS